MRPASLAILLLLVVSAGLYVPAIGYPYVYEDLNDRGSVVAVDKPVGNPLRVVTDLTFSAARTWGAGATADHVLSIALHVGNVALLVALAWLVLPPWSAVLAGAVFAMHPIQVEAVAYVSGRADLLAGSGVLLALLSTSRGSFAGACLGVLLACVSKESAVMAWALVPLWAILSGATFPVWRFLTAGAVGGVVVVGWFFSRVGGMGPELDLAHMGRTAWSVVRLTGLVFMPIGQSIDHDWRGSSLWVQSASVGALTLAAAWGLSQAQLARDSRGWSEVHRYAAFAVLGMLTWFAPRLIVPAVEGLHEHHLYVPMVGWSLCAGAGLGRFLDAQRG